MCLFWQRVSVTHRPAFARLILGRWKARSLRMKPPSLPILQGKYPDRPKDSEIHFDTLAPSGHQMKQTKELKPPERKRKKSNLRTFSHEYDYLAKIGIRKRSRCYWETRSNVKGQHEPTGTDNQTKINEKTHLLLRILAVIGRYGSHLMIVMIFVTQNNF